MSHLFTMVYSTACTVYRHHDMHTDAHLLPCHLILFLVSLKVTYNSHCIYLLVGSLALSGDSILGEKKNAQKSQISYLMSASFSFLNYLKSSFRFTAKLSGKPRVPIYILPVLTWASLTISIPEWYIYNLCTYIFMSSPKSFSYLIFQIWTSVLPGDFQLY